MDVAAATSGVADAFIIIGQRLTKRIAKIHVLQPTTRYCTTAIRRFEAHALA
jgi:hypothetical protein